MRSGPPLICTAVCAARLGEARVLAQSIAQFHDGPLLAVLVVGGPALTGPEPFEIVGIEDLGIPIDSAHELMMCAEGDDLAALFVPSLIQAMLVRDENCPVIYLDPETVVLGPLTKLGNLGATHGIVLAPRTAAPMPFDGRLPDNRWAANIGIIDPGCVATGDGAEAFLHWWSGALSAVTDDHVGFAHCQPFLDSAVVLFDVHVLRDPQYGLAYWNAHERPEVRTESGSSFCGDDRLTTVRLEGFDAAHPELLTRDVTTSPRILLSEHSGLAHICAEHAAALIAAESGLPAPGSDIVRMPDAVRVDERMRRLVRRARKAVRQGQSAQLAPDPFSATTLASFYTWLASPDPSDPLLPLLPRYLAEIYADRADLRWRLLRIGTVNAALFREWVERHGFEEEAVPEGLQLALRETLWWTAPTGAIVVPARNLLPGVVVAGYLRAGVGVGEAARLAVAAFDHAGIAVSPVVIGTPTNREGHRFAGAAQVADRLTNVVWSNADQLPGFASIAGPDFFAGRYTVGGWVWETERLPRAMAASAVLVDEIWVPSEFARQAIAPAVDRDVHLFPHPIVAPQISPAFKRADLGLPDGFLFLFTYDFSSSFTRKNPLGVLSAFTQAFAPGEGPTLVLKSVNGHRHIADLEKVRLVAAHRPDVIVLDEYLETTVQGSLTASCDCFVSLHRSEGFGLVLAEAMALGRPVIATGYSGNLQFMDDSTAYLVPAKRVAVGPGAYPYDPDDQWSDPDLDTAAECMRRVYESPGEARAVGVRAREHVLSEFGIDRAAHFVSGRLKAIADLRRQGYSSEVARAVAQWIER